jgi:protease-4
MKNVALFTISGNIAYENESIALLESFFSNKQSEEYTGILLWINSGGGSFCVAQDISAMLQRSALPCVAIIGELCASAAYYIALAAHRIIAQPASLVGGLCASIDVANYAKVHEKIGIQRIVYGNGQMKQMLSPYTGEQSEGEIAAVRDILDDLDHDFHSFIEKRRPQGIDLKHYFDGRLLSGMRAFKASLVDELGGLYEATKVMAHMLDSEAIEIISLEPEANDAPTNGSASDLVSSLFAALHIGR